jgi:hypothetical protein
MAAEHAQRKADEEAKAQLEIRLREEEGRLRRQAEEKAREEAAK